MVQLMSWKAYVHDRLMVWNPANPSKLALVPARTVDPGFLGEDEESDDDAVVYDVRDNPALVRFQAIGPVSFSPNGRWISCRARWAFPPV